MYNSKELEAIRILHDEGSHDYLVDYRYNPNDIFRVLSSIQSYNRFDSFAVIEFIEKLLKFYNKNIEKSVLNNIYFKFGKEYSSVLYICLDMRNEDLKRVMNSINQLKRLLNYDEYNVEKDKFGVHIIRIWFD
jgi:uncharacterized protein YktA (UPF0223 family)